MIIVIPEFKREKKPNENEMNLKHTNSATEKPISYNSNINVCNGFGISK